MNKIAFKKGATEDDKWAALERAEKAEEKQKQGFKRGWTSARDLMANKKKKTDSGFYVGS